MPNLLTRTGARSFTETLDRVANVVQKRHSILGLDEKVALDFAKRCDLVADAVEMTAAANFPIKEAEAEVSPVPAQQNDPEVKGVTDSSGGTTSDNPASSDQNKPETYYGLGGKKAADWPVQPGKDETGTSVEPAPAAEGFDANAIGDDRGGPRQQDADEKYMQGEFSQERFHTLRDRVQGDDLPRFNVVDPKLASAIDGIKDKETLAKAASLLREAVTPLKSLPGMAPMQLRAEIDRLADLRREIEAASAQIEDVLSKIKDLEKDEKAGLEKMKEAVAQLQEKGKYIAETEKAILQFEARVTTKVPGIEQMIATGEEWKPGQKAGDFFGRVARELGDEVGAAVQRIYEVTKEDLSHTTTAVYGLKVVVKSASFDAPTLKQAGISDVVVSIKEWLAGKADSVAQRVMKFTGDLAKWVRGFVERTKMVKRDTDKIQDLLTGTLKDIDKVLATAKTASTEENDWGFDLTK